MKYWKWAPAMLALSITGGAAQAQVVGGTTTPRSGIQGPLQFVPGQGFAPVNLGITGLRGPLQFVPGAGFAPANQGITGLRGPLQFVPGQGFAPFNGSAFPQAGQGPLQFVPGAGFAPANLGLNGVRGPLQFVPGAGFAPVNQSTVPQAGQGPLQFVPGVGFVPGSTTNAAGSVQFVPGVGFVQNGTGESFIDVPNFLPPTGFGSGGSGFFGNDGVADVSTVPTGVVNGVGVAPGVVGVAPGIVPQIGTRRGSGNGSAVRESAEDDQTARVALQMEDIMQNRPMTEGTVVRVGATSVKVRYELDGQIREELFPITDVFVFRRSSTGRETVQTVSTSPDMVKAGERVMIPLQPENAVRSAVAGSRQEIRSTPAAGTSREIVITGQKTANKSSSKARSKRSRK